MITIRPIQESDAAAFLALRTQLDAETHLMMLEPGERDQDLERQYAELRSVLVRANHTILLAVTEDQQLAGYLEAEGGRFRRNALYLAYAWAADHVQSWRELAVAYLDNGHRLCVHAGRDKDEPGRCI